MRKGRAKKTREEIASDDELRGSDESDDFDDAKKPEEVVSDEEVYGFGDSDDLGDDDDDDDEEVGDDDGGDKSNEDDFDMGSDIQEEEDALPDDRAWGKSSRRFYSTDFVDQDYEGFYEGKVAEEAELEEQEALKIQKRLAEQLNEADFVIAKPVDVQQSSDHFAFEAIETDVSKLSSRQKLDLLKKESPEFFVLVDDFKSKLIEIQDVLMPILDHFESKKQEDKLVIKFLQKKFLLYMNYCTNVSFYLLLKAKRIPVSNHPVLKSLFQYRKLLEQIKVIDDKIKPLVEKIVNALKHGQEPVLDEEKLRMNVKEKKILKLLQREKETRGKTVEVKGSKSASKKGKGRADEEDMDVDEVEKDAGGVAGAPGDKETSEEQKRAITYEMAKNKGLMPKRNKIQRNPRVKHRMKYKKALTRRKGQVRTPRREIPVYGGEMTGIKAGVTKSVKFK